MPGLASLFYLGQPDPAQQLARMLSGQQQPPQQQPPGAPGAAPPNGPAPGPADGSAPTQQQPDLAPGASPPPGSAPVPTALQSTPDMQSSYAQLAQPNIMSLYVQMAQRDQAMAGINNAFAQIAANHSPPSMRAAIMQNANAGGGDAGNMVGNLMSLYQNQQQMAAQQDMLRHADDYDTKLNLPPGTARDMIMAGRGSELVSQLMPTQATRDIQAKHDMFIKSGGTEQDWQTNYLPFILTGGAGGGDSATRSWQTERIRWNQDNPGQPYPWGTDDPQSFALWKNKQDELTKDQTDASNKRPQYVQNLTDLRNGLGSIIGLKPGDSFQTKDDGSLDTSNLDPAKYALLQSALSRPGAQAYLSGDPKDLTTQALGAAIPPEEKAVLDQVREVSNPKAIFGSLSGRAPRRSQSDVTTIGSGLEGLTNVRKSPTDWVNGLVKTVGSTDTAIGNAYGASGEPENAPEQTKKYIDSSYLPGGSMYPFGKKPLPPSADQLAEAQQRLTAAKQGGQDPEQVRAALTQYYLTHNLDATPLKKMKP